MVVVGAEFYKINAQPALYKFWLKVQVELGNVYQSFYLNVHLNVHLNVYNNVHLNGNQNVHIDDHINVKKVQV